MKRTVPLNHHGKHVGFAILEVDHTGVRVTSTNITDPEVKELFEKDILRMALPMPEKEE